jgi:leucyl aminopeptidase
MIRHLSTTALALLLTSSAIGRAGAEPASPRFEGKRLIETNPGQAFWATPAEIAEISEKAHRAGKCGGYMDLTDAPAAAKLPPLAPALLGLGELDPKEQARVTPLIAKADERELLALVTKLAAYDDRDYQRTTGVEAAEWIKSQYERIGSGRSDVRVELQQNSFKQPSVIATIEGSGENRNEIVVIGGHIDTISPGKAPGADDDASGTATVMETYRLLIESGYRPNRTIQFMGYAGEERGLLGSQVIANRYRQEGKVVAAALQFDMTMYPGSTPRITFITDHVSRELTTFVEKLSDEYVKAKWIEDKCGYACSDHASWTRAGYPSAFPFETAFDEYNPDIHTPKDTTSNLDAGHGVNYLKLSLAFAVEMAEAKDVATTPTTGGDDTGSGSSWPSSARHRISRR